MKDEAEKLFLGWQQALGYALFNQVFRQRRIGLLVGGAGTGKTEIIHSYIEHCAARRAKESERRRIIGFEDALERFEREQLFHCPATAKERTWLGQRFGAHKDCRMSPLELSHWQEAYRRQSDGPPTQLPDLDLGDNDPPTVPRPILVTPSATTTQTGLVRLVFDCLGRPRRGSAVYTEDFLLASLEELRQKYNTMLVFDEAQRMRAETLMVAREFHDDAGAPIVLVATPDIAAILNRPMLASVRSRIAIREEIKPLSEKQLAAFLPHLGPRLIAVLHGCSQGMLRTVLHLLEASEQVRLANNGAKLTVEYLEEACLMVPEARRYAARGRTVRAEESADGEWKDDKAAAASEATIRRKAAQRVG